MLVHPNRPRLANNQVALQVVSERGLFLVGCERYTTMVCLWPSAGRISVGVLVVPSACLGGGYQDIYATEFGCIAAITYHQDMITIQKCQSTINGSYASATCVLC